MKPTVHILLLFSILSSFCSCGHKPYPQPLAAADKLTSTCPDSALTLLKSMESAIENEPEATQMYYRLLCIKANDKAYIPHTSDSLILPVLHYYIEKNDKRHLPEAYYYAGRVYRDLGDAPQALDYFEKAMEILPEKGEYDLKSRIYSQMGTLFAYQDMYAEALKMYKMSHHCDSLLKDSIGMIFALRDIGNMYQELNKQDSTLVYLKKANLFSERLQRTDLFNMVQSQLAALYTDLQEYDSARVALQNALKDIEQPNKSGIYNIAARFYEATGNTDSAVWYYNKLLDFGSVYAKKTANCRLLERAIKRNDTEQAAHYLYGFFQYTDSIQALTQTETTHRMHSLYNYQLREKENLQLKTENRNKTFWLTCIVSVLIIIIASFITYRQYNKRKRLELEKKLEKLRTIEKENQKKIESLEKYRSQKKVLENNLTGISVSDASAQKEQIGQKIELINYFLQQQVIEEKQEIEAQKHLFSSDLYKQLQERTVSVRGDAYITSKEWETLRGLMTPAYPTFFERLYSLHTPSENELHVCILIKLKFRQADIARLLQLKSESISSIRRRLYQKVTESKGTPEMWDKIIYSL